MKDRILQTKTAVILITLVTMTSVSVALLDEPCTMDSECSGEREQCVDTDGNFTKDTCGCRPGFYPDHGQCWSEHEPQLADPCDSRPCQHGGDCASRNREELMCHCMPGYTGVLCEEELLCQAGTYFDEDDNTCSQCDVGTYSSNESGREASCLPCPTDAQGVKSTTRNPGASNKTQCVFNPSVESLSLQYGPVAGGTLITLTLTHLDSHQVVSVQIGQTPCVHIQTNYSVSSVTCLTSPMPSDSSQPSTSQLRVTFKDGYVTEGPFNFSYKADPVIETIDNYNTIISGGLTLTVRGRNLDSVAVPQLVITRFHEGRTQQFSSDCMRYDSSVMGCLTPNLALGMDHPLFAFLKDESAGDDRRERRQVLSAPTFNDRNTQFYVGFRMDGVQAFANMSTSSPAYGQLPVYPDPTLFEFEEEGMVKEFSADSHTYLHLKGKFLNAACRDVDFAVTVGRNVCDITHLATNQLTCMPPASQPELEDNGYGPGETPRVTVYVGSLIYVIGYLDYVTAQSDVDDSMVGAIVAVVVFVPIIIISALIGVYLRRRRDRAGKKSQSIRSILTADSNVYLEQDGARSSPRSPASARLAASTTNSRSLHPSQVTNSQPMAQYRHLSSAVSPPDTPGSISLAPGEAFDTAYFSPAKPTYFDVLDEIDEDLKLLVQECQLKSERLTVGDMVGQGYFGNVYKGELTNEHLSSFTTVAVKTIQDQHCTMKDVTSFLQEAVVMKDFNHPNVLSLLGVVIVNNKPFVVLPYMEHGDLKSYIKEPTRRIKVRELLAFGVQIANGMSYLANQKFVHRDLATRNCMVNGLLYVKIADFGLSRDIYKSDYYRVEDKKRPLPVKWMAMESLTHGMFSTKTDVWSYGVVLWELLTRGCTPYPDVSTFNIKAYVLSGRRLSQPEHAPDDVYELMCRCWRERPDERPQFGELYNDLKDIINDRTTANRPEYLQLIDA